MKRLILGQGRLAGTHFKLLPWQKKFLKGAFSTDGDAAVSMGRGNGKTCFIASMAFSAVVGGPLVQPMGEVIVVASSV